MYIRKKDWNKLQEYMINLEWGNDYLSRDGRYFLREINSLMKELEMKPSNKIFIITNNCIEDYDANYHIAGVTTDLDEAKSVLCQAIKDIKTDINFDSINPIRLTDDIDCSEIEGWVYQEDEYGFNLYLNEEQSRFDYSVQIEQFPLEMPLDEGLYEV